MRRCNRAMTMLLSVAYGDLEGTYLADLLLSYFDVDLATFQTDTSVVVQRQGRFFRLGTGVLPDNEGTHGSIFIVADVTPQKQAEQALLLNERLAATGRMAHTIAHEINNPLEAITNLIYLCQTAPANDADTRSYLASAAEELQRISQITRQILSFNREASHPASIPIAQLVEDVVLLSARHEVDKQIRTSLELNHSLIVKGYPARLRQAFANLIRNAMEASEKGGVIRVRVSKALIRHAGLTVPAARISISDRGSGISLEHREKVFEAFYTTKAQKGSGIGLWLTHSVIQEHQGKLQMRTATDIERQGTTFSILLPM